MRVRLTVMALRVSHTRTAAKRRDRIRSRPSHADRCSEGDRGGRAPGGARARGREQAQGQGPRRRSCRSGAGADALLPDARLRRGRRADDRGRRGGLGLGRGRHDRAARPAADPRARLRLDPDRLPRAADRARRPRARWPTRRRPRSRWRRFRASPARSRWTRCPRRATSPATRRRCSAPRRWGASTRC